MSGPFGSQQWMYASGGFYPHEINNSARLDTNSYYSKTFSSAGTEESWTWSGWLKKGPNEENQKFFSAAINDSTYFNAMIYTDDIIWVRGVISGSALINLKTTAVFRDPSAWYHVVIAFDTANATASDRVLIYVNGERITDFSTATYPSQNLSTNAVNRSATHYIGKDARSTRTDYWNGYVAEINFVDGQTLSPTSFGELKSGAWIPKSYSGSYGTNGFYLDFGNSGSLGADSSGNGNNWTPNNLTATDQVLDSPTNNFATWNPITNSTQSLSEGNLKGTAASSGNNSKGNVHQSSGKWYYEALWVSGSLSSDSFGITQTGGDSTTTRYLADGRIRVEGTYTDTGLTTFTSGDVIGVAYDLDSKTVSFYKNNTLIATKTITIGEGMQPLSYAGGARSQVANFGQDSSFAGQKTAQGNTDANGIGDFYYSPPSGYLALCSANLPDPVAAIDPNQDANPSDYFNTVLYTGTGSQQSITGVGFQPDWLWIKARNFSSNHQTVNAIRGASPSTTEILEFDNTDAELNTNNRVKSLDSDGFTVGGRVEVNDTGDSYVAWSWKMDGSGSANSDGSITTLATSANQDLGISMIHYRADGNSSGSVGTGLDSSKPIDMAIVKKRNGTSEYQVGHRFSGQGSNFAYHSEFNHTTVLSGSAPYFMGSQSSTDGSLLYLASGATSSTADRFFCWVFQSVEGFSKFGSYTGNASSDGPFVYTGFRPAFLIIKNVDSADQWFLNDNKRDSYNLVDEQILVNSSAAEATSRGIDFLSNGFKIRDASTTPNGSGNTMIYMAFAEMPFKYANAR